MVWFAIAGVFCLAVYEFWAAITHDGLTISQAIWRASKWPVVPFAFGFLMGHLFA